MILSELLRHYEADKRIQKFLTEEDVIHLKISCQTARESALLENDKLLLFEYRNGGIILENRDGPNGGNGVGNAVY